MQEKANYSIKYAKYAIKYANKFEGKNTQEYMQENKIFKKIRRKTKIFKNAIYIYIICTPQC